MIPPPFDLCALIIKAVVWGRLQGLVSFLRLVGGACLQELWMDGVCVCVTLCLCSLGKVCDTCPCIHPPPHTHTQSHTRTHTRTPPPTHTPTHPPQTEHFHLLLLSRCLIYLGRESNVGSSVTHVGRQLTRSLCGARTQVANDRSLDLNRSAGLPGSITKPPWVAR